MSLRIAVAGSSLFTCPTLDRLYHHSPHEIIAVITQPDKPTGRGRIKQPNPLKSLALSYDIPIWEPLKLNVEHWSHVLREHHLDCIVVAAYGRIMPETWLTIPRLGCLNIHASLLPRWRGASPIQQSLLHGDLLTGISIMQMDQGLDTGDILHQVEYTIGTKETSESLLSTLADLGSHAITDVLMRFGEYQNKRGK